MKVVIEKRYEQLGDFQSILEYLSNFSEFDVILENDTGFITDDQISPYRFFVSKQSNAIHYEQNLFYNNLTIPEFWDVRASGMLGEICNENEVQAKIYFKEPVIERNIEAVEWYHNQLIYKKDYYDKFGLKYFSEYFDEKGMLETRTYYADNDKEVIIEQFQNEAVFLINSGNVKRYFESYVDFIKYFIDEFRLENT